MSNDVRRPPLCILIADDEKPARGELRYMLGQLEAGATVLEARNGSEVFVHLAHGAVDVIFLDINMPGQSGLAVAAAILERPNPPLVVFATAYDAHAVRAFELAALDYIVKPFAEQRLAQSMVRIRQALAARDAHAERLGALRTYLQRAGVAADFTRLWCERANGNGVLVEYGDVLWVEAEEKRVYVQSRAGDRLEVRTTLKELEARLAPYHIVRVHKAYLVNLAHVREIVPWFSGAYLLRMDDDAGSEIPMSRQYAAQLKEMARR
jgi:DNA-binding LytR/AlgR family response regulator